MKTQTKVLAALFSATLSTLALTTAHAGLVAVDFSDSTNTGTFTYDDSVATNGTGNPFQQGGVSYDGISFTVNGTPQSSPFYIEIYNDFSNGYDIAYFTAGSTGNTANPLLQLACDNNCLGDSSLTQLTGLTLATFVDTSGEANNFYPGQYDGFSGGNNLVSATISAVPAPATLALLALGMLGLGVRRRKTH